MKKLIRLAVFLLIAALTVPLFMGYEYKLQKKDDSDFSQIASDASVSYGENVLVIIENEGEVLSLLLLESAKKKLSYIDSGLFSYISQRYENSERPGESAAAALLGKSGICAKYISMPLSLVRELTDRIGGIRPVFDDPITIGSHVFEGEEYVNGDTLYSLLLYSGSRRDIISPILSAFIKSAKKSISPKTLISFISGIYKKADTDLSVYKGLVTLERAGSVNTDIIGKFSY